MTARSYIEKGDTIIEVILGVTLFSFVAVGVMSLMNHGVMMAQQSLETTLVRNQIDAQAEIIRFVHDRALAGDPEYSVLWGSIVSMKVSPSVVKSTINSATTSCQSEFSTNGFALGTTAAGGLIKKISNYKPAEVYASVKDETAYGIELQITKVEGEYAYDVYIQTCWTISSSSMPLTIGTIVRIYDPSAS